MHHLFQGLGALQRAPQGLEVPMVLLLSGVSGAHL